MHMDAREFVFMCGTIASKHDTALAHAMLHAVAVWVDSRWAHDAPWGHAGAPATTRRTRGRG